MRKILLLPSIELTLCGCAMNTESEEKAKVDDIIPTPKEILMPYKIRIADVYLAQ